MNSAFKTWFIEQYGPRHHEGEPKTDTELLQAILAGKKADEILLRRYSWDAKETAALYAWQASPERSSS